MRCSRCRKAWYCGQDHQRSHWPKHKVECRPYTKEEEEQEEEYTALQEHLVNKGTSPPASPATGAVLH